MIIEPIQFKQKYKQKTVHELKSVAYCDGFPTEWARQFDKKKNHFEMKKYQHFSRIIETADYQKLPSLIRNVRIFVTFHFDYYSMHLKVQTNGLW